MRISDWSSDVCSSDLVDRLDETCEPRDELIARTRVDLPIFLDIEGVRTRLREEFVAPVPCDTRLDAVLVIEGDGVGAVAEAGQRELCHRRRLRVVDRKSTRLNSSH